MTGQSLGMSSPHTKTGKNSIAIHVRKHLVSRCWPTVRLISALDFHLWGQLKSPGIFSPDW